MFVVDLQLRKEPAYVKNIPRRVPESQSLGWRPPFLGSVPFRFLGREEGGEGVPLSFASGSVRLDGGSRASPNRVQGWCRRGEWSSLRRGTPLTLPLCGVGSSLTPFEHVLCRTAQAPSLSQRVPAIKRHPATYLKLRSMFLPWVFTGSGVSTTPQRLWPAAPWTGNYTGTEDLESIWCSMQPGHAIAISPRPPQGDQGPLPKFMASVEVLQEVPRPTALICQVTAAPKSKRSSQP